MLTVARRFKRGLSLLTFGLLIVGCSGMAFSQGNSGDALLERLNQIARLKVFGPLIVECVSEPPGLPTS